MRTCQWSGDGDEHGIDIFGQHLVIIDMGGRDAVGPFLHFIAARPIDVAHGHDLVGGAGFVGGIKQGSHPAAGSDDSDAKGVVCTQNSG